MLWLALQFPALGLEVFEASAAEPTVLLEDNRVGLCNEPAAQTGILPGCTLATAHSISATLKHFQRDPSRESARLKFLAETLYRFSAQVSIEPPDGLVLEIGSSLELFGDAAELAQAASQLCENLGHQVQKRTAPTPLAALVMARAGAQRLQDVPIAQAQIPAASKHVERFANMGMHTLGPLLHLPELELGQRFGPDLLAFLSRLTGQLPDPRHCIEPSAEFDQALHLLEPIQDKNALLFPMQRLLNDLEHWLVARQLGAEQLCWHFTTHTGDQCVSLPLRFARAQQSKGAFLSISRLKLEQTELPCEILNIRLEAARLTAWQGGSQDLFRGLSDQALEAPDLSELIDQLHARLGGETCSGIAIRNQHAPEAAWHQDKAVTKAHARARVQADASASIPTDLPRPLWLFDPPHLTDRERLTLLKGPERIQTAWWQKTIWRDYYVARLESGARCWAFMDARDQWYLHGYFA